MVTIELAQTWTYRTPEKTITYPAGTHAVHKYIAEKAVADGAIEDFDDGNAERPAKTGKKGAADNGKG